VLTAALRLGVKPLLTDWSRGRSQLGDAALERRVAELEEEMRQVKMLANLRLRRKLSRPAGRPGPEAVGATPDSLPFLRWFSGEDRPQQAKHRDEEKHGLDCGASADRSSVTCRAHIWFSSRGRCDTQLDSPLSRSPRLRSLPYRTGDCERRLPNPTSQPIELWPARGSRNPQDPLRRPAGKRDSYLHRSPAPCTRVE